MAEFFSGRCNAETKQRFSALFDEEEISFDDKINVMLDSFETLHRNNHKDPVGFKISINAMKRSLENFMLQLDEMERLYNTVVNELSDGKQVSALMAENEVLRNEIAELRQKNNSLQKNYEKTEADYKDAVRALISLESKVG